MPNIQLKNVTVEYTSRKKEKVIALDNFSATFVADSFNVIVGYSGCGKTTLLKTIGGIQKYIGNVLIDGCEIQDLSPSSINIAYVSQNYTLYPHLTVFENIAFPLSIGGAKREEIIKRVKEIAEKFDLMACLSRKPRHLSGGQQQRVALARAMVKRPSIVLMDEPLSNVDPQARASARFFIKKVLQSYGCTTVYVTHDIKEAMAMADQLFVMNKGKLEMVGAPMEVYQSQNEVVNSLIAQ